MTDLPASVLASICDDHEKRIAELEAERDGLKKFIAKQSEQFRALQRRLAAAGVDARIPPLEKPNT